MLTDPVLSSVVWHTLANVAKKAARRELLDGGAKYDVDLVVTGHVAGQPIDPHKIAGKLLVADDYKKCTSTTPALAHVIALILSRLNTATREHLLRTIPEEFAAAGNRLPDVTDEQVEAADRLLTQLRAKQTITAKGPVALRYNTDVGG